MSNAAPLPRSNSASKMARRLAADKGGPSTQPFAEIGSASPAAVVELVAGEIVCPFDTLNPFPFQERDRGRDAEDYIVGWA